MSANDSITIVSASAVTASQSSSSQYNAGHRGAHIVINATAVASGASLTPSIVGICKGVEYTILGGSAISSTGTTVLKVYPGITAAANAAASDVLPQQWRVDVAVTGGAVSFSVGASPVV